ncbi:MAG: PKD domain-containing protein [Acidobacteria bacterium]|nr:PKD domain-containing protein [Acidobacteriota bacterium]
MRQVRNVCMILTVLAACWCLSLAQSSAPDPNQSQGQQQTTAGGPQAGSATIMTAGSRYKDRIKWLQPTLHGSPGLFNVFSAEGLRRGEFSLQLGVSNYDRDPGDLDITDFPVTFNLGLHDRIEWGVEWIAQRRTDADNIRTFQIPPTGPVRPTRIAAPGSPIAYYNGAPFIDVGFGAGPSDAITSLKVNLMSENRNHPFGLAVRGNVKIPTSRHIQSLTGGRTTGETDGGVQILASKYAGLATVMLNGGVQWIGDPRQVELRNEFRYGAGVAFGTHPIQAIFEANGTTWFGSVSKADPTRFSDLANPRSPLDLTFGLRFLPSKWVSIGAAYRFAARTWSAETVGAKSTDRSGYLVSLGVNRKVDRPPTVECQVDSATIQQRGRATVKATANDPDDSELTIGWRTTGGRLVGTGESITFEAGDLTETAPGRYTVTADASDGKTTATCSADITVEKLKIAPKVTCDPTAQTINMGETANVRATASDENPGDMERLTYAWEVDGQRVAETGNAFTFGTTGRTPGRHTVRVTVTDPDGLTASCESTVEVTAPPPPPNHPPTCDLTLARTELYVGASLRATVRASDPDGDRLAYEWSLDGRTLSDKTTAEIDIDTAGLSGGSHSVTVKVSDDKGASVTCSASFTVRGKIVIELPALRIDNAAKAKLDDVALQLQGDPRLSATITGYDVARSERIAQRNGLRLARLAKDYLVKQHKIDASRIETKSGGQSTPRRIEIEIASR